MNLRVYQPHNGRQIIYFFDKGTDKYATFLESALSLFHTERIEDIQNDLAIKVEVSFEGGSFIVKCNSLLFGCFRQENEFLDAMLSVLYIPDLYADDNFGFLHGGCVERNGCAFAFIAATLSGKSSSIFGLCLRGCAYISDDLLVYRYLDKAVYPYPLPLAMRNIAPFCGFDIDNNYKKLPFTISNSKRGSDDQKSLYLPGNVTNIAKGYPLKRIYLLNRSANIVLCEISPISRRDAFLVLYKNCSNPFTLRNNSILALEISKAGLLYRIDYGNGFDYLDKLFSHLQQADERS